MCRRWTGGPFATLAWYPQASVRWTSRQPVEFRSSPIAVRSHCDVCGTPLHIAYDGQSEIAVSTGSACTSATAEPSYVLRALGRDERLSESSLRFGLGRSNCEADIDAAIAVLQREVRRLRRIAGT